jgi:hypothetical protein
MLDAWSLVLINGTALATGGLCIRSLVHQARKSSKLELSNLGAWSHHPMVIEAIKEKIDTLLVVDGSQTQHTGEPKAGPPPLGAGTPQTVGP